MIKQIWNTILFYPFLNILFAFYLLYGENLGLAVITIAILSRLLLIPLTKKQMEDSEKVKNIQPKLKKLQKKYANNQEKLAQEQMKLYKKEGYNPLGCFGNTVIQLALLLVIVNTIRVITADDFIKNLEGIYPFIKNWASGISEVKNTFLGIPLDQDFRSIIEQCDCIPYGGPYEYQKWNLLFTEVQLPNMKEILNTILIYVMGPFKVPQSAPYMVIALLVGVVQYFSTRFLSFVQGKGSSEDKDDKSGKKDKKKEAELSPEEIQEQTMKNMAIMMPILSIFITLKTPAVLGVYWATQSLMTFVQYYFIKREKTVEFFTEKVFNFKNK